VFSPCLPQRELAHDNFRRTHHDFRRTHHEDWWPHDHFIATFVARVSVPATVGNDAAGGGEKGDDTGKEQEHFHIYDFVFGRKLRDGRPTLYGV